jgi:hypothetical protein
MKNLLTAAALLALTATVHAQTPPLNRTQDYRVWSAERMIERLVVRFEKTIAACNQVPFSDCKAAAIKAYPTLNSIRELAAIADDVQWAKLIDTVHTFERDNEAVLNALKF